MKVVVKDYLNVRVGKPSVNAPCYQYLAPGSEIEVDGMIYQGDPYEGVDTWLRDNAGNYYWKGGINYQKKENTYQDWMLRINLPQIWKKATGKGVGIAILDTGVSTNNRNIYYDKVDFFVFDAKVSIEDKHGHGTHCAGLIASRNIDKSVGVAYESNLYVVKIADSGSISQSDTIRYAEAINWCASHPNIHVISISWGSFIRNPTIKIAIQTAIDNAVKKNKIVVCAMGDATQFNDPGPIFPVCFNNTIGIGSIPVDKLLYPYLNESLTLLLDGFNIPSYKLSGELIEMSGTSQSTAIAAGLVALLIEKKNFNYTLGGIRQSLVSSCKQQVFYGIPLPVLDGNLLLNQF